MRGTIGFKGEYRLIKKRRKRLDERKEKRSGRAQR